MKRFFHLLGFDREKHSVRTEVVAGLTTFITMAYILAVNPAMFADLGNVLGPEHGMPVGAQFTATTLAAAFGCLMMALLAKKPFGLAPGMGLNAFFIYTVCIGMHYSWQFALTAVFIEGIIFIILSVTKVRDMLVKAIPPQLGSAISVGIGLFIAYLGLVNCGFITAGANGLALGDLSVPSTLLAIVGFMITASLLVCGMQGALLVGMLITALIGVPFGLIKLEGVVSMPESIAPIFCQFEWNRIFSYDMLIVVFTFLFMDIFDTMGTVIGLSVKTDMVDKDGNVDRLSQLFTSDALATTAGACFGTSTTTTLVESAAGVAAGGRTGLTAFVIAICFLLALFFSPLFLSITGSVTGPVLVLIGVMMCSPISKIEWDRYTEAIPAFVTMFIMPTTGSISNGIMFGVITYVLLNLVVHGWKSCNITMYILAVVFLLKFIFVA